jgi:hypothetical protein
LSKEFVRFFEVHFGIAVVAEVFPRSKEFVRFFEVHGIDRRSNHTEPLRAGLRRVACQGDGEGQLLTSGRTKELGNTIQEAQAYRHEHRVQKERLEHRGKIIIETSLMGMKPQNGV